MKMFTKRCLRESQHKAQSLVETSIIVPILVLFLLGVFEVGWALRGYLVLANANREAARFAIRPRYVNYDDEYPDYTPIVTQAFNSLSNQIPFTNSGVIIVSRIFIDTGYPCDPAELLEMAHRVCDWQVAMAHPYTPTIVITPLDVATYTFTYPATSTQHTRLDYNALKEQLIARNFQHNAELMERTGWALPQADDVIIVEMFFNQPQLLGFPGLSNSLMDPIHMYTSTFVRRFINRS
jgi:hypothetical protein